MVVRVEFPVYPPPGIIILLAGAGFVALARWPWAPAVGALLGLFVTVGFLISPTGWSNPGGCRIGAVLFVVGGEAATRGGAKGKGSTIMKL